MIKFNNLFSTLNKLLSIIIFTCFWCNIIFAQENQWNKIKIPYSDYVYSLYSIPNGNIFASSWNGGLFVSKDDGMSWKKLLNDVVKSFNFIQGKLYAVSNNVLLISKDNGINWTRFEYPFSIQSVSENSKGMIFASRTPGGGGLIRSKDGGNTYAAVFSVDIGGMIIHPNGAIYITAKSQTGAANYTKLYKSIDDGDSWSEVNLNSIVNDPTFTSISMNPEGKIFICSQGSYPPYITTIIQSDVQGNNFKSATTTGINDYINSLYFSKTKEIYFATNHGILKSDSSGNSLAGIKVAAGNINISAITQNTLGDILVSVQDGYCAGGILSSKDNGQNWYQTGLNNQSVVSSITFDKNNNIYVSTTTEIYRYEPMAPGWRMLLNKKPHEFNSVGISPSGKIIVPSFPVFISSDNGNNFDEVRLPYETIATNILFKDTNFVFIGTYSGLFLSSKSAENNSWRKTGALDKYIYCMGTDKYSNIYFGSDDGLSKSTDNGDTWTKIFYPGFAIKTLAISSSNQFYAGADGKGLYKSKDGGATWLLLNTGVTTTSIQSIICSDSLHIYISLVDGGVYGSNNQGETWRSLNKGLGDLFVKALALDKNGNLYCSTNSGLYKSLYPDPEYHNKPLPSDYKLFENYPNPFNSSTTIRYRLPVDGNVRITLYNILGQEIRILLNGFNEAGEYDMLLDGSKLASGVYFYTLRAGEFIQTKKLILLK